MLVRAASSQRGQTYAVIRRCNIFTATVTHLFLHPTVPFLRERQRDKIVAAFVKKFTTDRLVQMQQLGTLRLPFAICVAAPGIA